MGKKGGSSYHERPLSEEEKQLLRQQQIYLASIQPSIDKLVTRGTNLLDNVVNPDWQSIYTNTVNDIDGLRKEQAELATGKLPKAYADAKTDYFNRIYENTMGQQLSAMAKKGIVDSSRFNSTTNDMQKNMAAQMSKPSPAAPIMALPAQAPTVLASTLPPPPTAMAPEIPFIPLPNIARSDA